MGTLIGAPLGIALIAGLAVPGIICGVPIFVGRFFYDGDESAHTFTVRGWASTLLIGQIFMISQFSFKENNGIY